MKLVFVLLAGCAIAPASLPASHPASPSAPTGRLAGPPAELREGAVKYDDVPPVRAEPPAHHHHHP